MKFNVKRNDLLNELNLVKGVVEKKTTIPILSNILLEAKEGHLYITATDLDVTISCGCEATIEAPGVTTLSAHRLHDIARLMPDDADINFSVKNDWVNVTSKTSKYKVAGLSQENFPMPPVVAGPVIDIPGKVLRAMIQRTMFAISQEDGRYAIGGAQLIVTPKEIRMIATDGHRLAMVTMPTEIPVDAEIKALIPRKALVELLKLINEDDTVSFARDVNHQFFAVGDKRLVSRNLASQFPNYEMVIPKKNNKVVTASSRAMIDGIRRAAIMSDDKLRAVQFAFSPGAAEVSATNADAGEALETIPVEYEGAKVKIRFNPQYVLDFLGACDTETISMFLKDDETQGMLQPGIPGEIDYRYVVMPMKY